VAKDEDILAQVNKLVAEEQELAEVSTPDE